MNGGSGATPAQATSVFCFSPHPLNVFPHVLNSMHGQVRALFALPQAISVLTQNLKLL
jgi:hypothetical protein